MCVFLHGPHSFCKMDLNFTSMVSLQYSESIKLRLSFVEKHIGYNRLCNTLHGQIKGHCRAGQPEQHLDIAWEQTPLIHISICRLMEHQNSSRPYT